MFFQVSAMTILIAFCGFYISKIISQNKQSIKTDRMGIGNKPKKVLFIEMCLLFFNIPLLVVSVWAAVMLHFQILQEEDHMGKMFGKDHVTYMKHTLRYLGKR